MGDETQTGVRNRVFDGQITDGFSKYRLQDRVNVSGDESVRVMSKTRKHTFKRGYVDDGTPEHPITQPLSIKEAKAVRDLLTYWIEQHSQDTNPDQ